MFSHYLATDGATMHSFSTQTIRIQNKLNTSFQFFITCSMFSNVLESSRASSDTIDEFGPVQMCQVHFDAFLYVRIRSDAIGSFANFQSPKKIDFVFGISDPT